MKRFFSLILGMGITALGIAQGYDLNKKLPISSDVRIGTLDNGLKYYVRSNPKPEDKIELRLVVNAGSVLETDEQRGLAHFMEHMNFNGTKNFEKNDLVDYLQSIGVKFGADLNAYTSFDETVYILPIPCDNPETLEKGFQVIEDWAHNATLTEEAIDDERGVVLEEYRLGLGADKRMLAEYLPKLMYGSKYADRLPIGTKDVLENFDYEAVRSFYKDWYRPDLMAVVAVGDLPVDEIEAKVKEHFSRLEMPEKPKERMNHDLPNHKETFIAIATDKEAPFANVQIMYKDYENSNPDVTYGDYRQSIVENLFGTMINNRLSELANSPTPPFVFASTGYGGTFARTKSAYQSFAFTSPDGQLNAFKVLLEENQRVKQFGFQEGELDRARKSLLAGLERQYNDRDKMESGRLLGEYIRNYLEDEPIPGIEAEFEMYKEFLPEITLDEINALIKRFIHEDNRVIIFTGPDKEGVEPVTEDQVRAVLEEVESAEITAYEDEAVAETMIANMPTKGSIVSTSENKEVGSVTMELSNGAKVTYKKTDFKNDEIAFQAYSPGGISLYTDEEILATTFANGGLTSAGIGGFSLNDLSKFMSGKIARANPSIRSDGEYFSGSAAPKDLETLMQMVYLYFTDLNKDDEAYQSFLNKQKGFIGNMMADPGFFFQNAIGDHRNKGNSRYLGFPTEEKLDAADYDLAYVKYKERFADASDFHFYFVGNVDPKQLVSLSEQYLASLPNLGRNESYRAPTFKSADKFEKFVVNKGSEPKSSVRISWQEELEYSNKMNMIMAALGEVVSIKLVEILREEEGGVYGVGARGSVQRRPYGRVSFSISFPCGPENVDKLVELAIAEVDRIKKEGVSEKDLNKVKETYLVDFKEQLKTNRFWINELLEADKEEEDPTNILKFEEKVKAMTAEELQEAAKKYLDDQYFLAILMPEE